jgi:hypothetical protein
MNQSTIKIVINLLLAIQNLCAAAIEAISQEQEIKCDHKNKMSTTVMGGPISWMCSDCGENYTDK